MRVIRKMYPYTRLEDTILQAYVKRKTLVTILQYHSRKTEKEHTDRVDILKITIVAPCGWSHRVMQKSNYLNQILFIAREEKMCICVSTLHYAALHFSPVMKYIFQKCAAEATVFIVPSYFLYPDEQLRPRFVIFANQEKVRQHAKLNYIETFIAYDSYKVSFQTETYQYGLTTSSIHQVSGNFK